MTFCLNHYSILILPTSASSVTNSTLVLPPSLPLILLHLH